MFRNLYMFTTLAIIKTILYFFVSFFEKFYKHFAKINNFFEFKITDSAVCHRFECLQFDY